MGSLLMLYTCVTEHCKALAKLCDRAMMIILTVPVLVTAYLQCTMKVGYLHSDSECPYRGQVAVLKVHYTGMCHDWLTCS